MENMFFYIQFMAGLALILTTGLSIMYWPDIEGFLLKKGWIKWLNKKHDRENEKLDAFLKETQKRHIKRES